MFFRAEILARGKPLGSWWLAAHGHLPTKAQRRKLSITKGIRDLQSVG